MHSATLATCLTLALVGCAAAHAPESIRDEPVSYNRREMPPQQGLLTGPDGAWTVYRNDEERVAQPTQQEKPPDPPAPPAPKHREILCDRDNPCPAPGASH
jgi:hypothetical protein